MGDSRKIHRYFPSRLMEGAVMGQVQRQKPITAAAIGSIVFKISMPSNSLLLVFQRFFSYHNANQDQVKIRTPNIDRKLFHVHLSSWSPADDRMITFLL